MVEGWDLIQNIFYNPHIFKKESYLTLVMGLFQKIKETKIINPFYKGLFWINKKIVQTDLKFLERIINENERVPYSKEIVESSKNALNYFSKIPFQEARVIEEELVEKIFLAEKKILKYS